MGAISALFVIFYLGGWSTNSFGKICDSALFFKKEYNFNFSIKDFFEQIQILKNPFFESFVSSFKIVFICMLFIFVRAALPRKRFDQLIQLCWKYFFMVTLSLVIFYIGIFTFVVCNFEWTHINSHVLFLPTICTIYLYSLA
jgi:NADH:ubiquinone oxidoreductase subunit H